MPQAKTETFNLVRGLGSIAAISIVIGNVVGQGVFLKARVMTCNVGTPGKVIGAWVAAGLLSLAGALTYAELAAMMPRAGGEYVFVRDAYGSRLGFLYGWMQILIGKTGSQASLAVGFSIFLNILLGGILNFNLFTISIYGFNIPFGGLQLVGLGSILVLTAINCAAVSVSGFIAALLTVLKITMVIGIGVGAFFFASGDWTHFAQSDSGGICEGVSAGGRMGLGGFAAAMLGALWG
ncbi:MAG: amino acid permease, partial [Pyrinomonadaceae bacterium]